MSVYRVKQFIWAAKSLLQDVDTTYVNKFLNSDEKKLFNKLKKPDKHHCIRVCKDAIDISKEKNMNVNRVWFDVEGYWNDFASNRVFFETMINKQRSIGFAAGIYTSYYMWSIIFDLSYTFQYASEYPLWYAHYDWVENFSDFDAFGGWTTPYMKQYAGEAITCNFDVDYNYRAD